MLGLFLDFKKLNFLPENVVHILDVGKLADARHRSWNWNSINDAINCRPNTVGEIVRNRDKSQGIHDSHEDEEYDREN